MYTYTPYMVSQNTNRYILVLKGFLNISDPQAELFQNKLEPKLICFSIFVLMVGALLHFYT